MKILHVTQNYFPSVGGPQYTMKHVSEKLVAYYNDELEVATTNSLYNPESTLYKLISPAFELINGVAVHRLPFNRWHFPFIKYGGKVVGKLFNKSLPHSISKLRWSLDSPAIDEMMKISKADVIMATTSNYNFCNYPLWRMTTKHPKPFILYGAIHLHAALPYHHPSFVKARACDCYIANTDFEKEELIKNGVSRHKIETIGTGITIEDYYCDVAALAAFKAKNKIQEDDVVIGFIGRLVKGKGVGILMDALRKLIIQHKNIKLLLAGGTTDYVPAIKKAIDEEKLPIILIENFAEEEKAVLFNALDIFVLASQSESFGVVFLEAWACKKPVIGTRMGAVESLLNEGKDGLLFNTGDVDDLSRQLLQLINSKNLCNQLGEGGFKKVLERFTWPTIVAQYRKAYERGIENFESTHSIKQKVN